MDPITFIAFSIFGAHVAGRLLKRFKVVSDIPWWAGTPTHFGVGAFITRVPVEWAWLVSALYVIYEVLDWRINNSDAATDVGAFLAGVVTGLGYDIAKF
jgi:hypothetical protein